MQKAILLGVPLVEWDADLYSSRRDTIDFRASVVINACRPKLSRTLLSNSSTMLLRLRAPLLKILRS